MMGETSPSASTVQDAREDAVAVIGMACRLPRAATPEAYWRLLSEGVSAVGAVPADRWDLDDLTLDDLTPDAGRPCATAASSTGSRLRRRLLRDLAAGGRRDGPATADGARTGLGGARGGSASSRPPCADCAPASSSARSATTTRRGPRQPGRTAHPAQPSACGRIIANRVSYLLGLRGPSLTVDTGQSSSLVAVHLALREPAPRARAGSRWPAGSTSTCSPDQRGDSARFGALSPDGRCHVFDERANGYVRGEGGGLVLLKPLAAALADGDRMHVRHPRQRGEQRRRRPTA